MRRSALAALPLALLPLTRALGGSAQSLAAAVLGALTLGLLLRSAPPTERDPRERTTWQLALLGVTLCFVVVYLAFGARVRGNWDNDSAYYFGVARHMARTHRFEEPLVWHFLSPPASILHPPFDYWGGVTSLLLVPPMLVFGPTTRVAMLTMATLSSASLVLFWWLLCVEIRLRSYVLEVVAIVVFAFTPWLKTTRFDTESVVPFQLVLLLALVLLARGRLRAAVVVAFLLIVCRAEGVVLASMLWAAAALMAGASRVRSLLLPALSCVGLYVLYNVVSFGTVVPPGVRAAASLELYNDLYAYGGHVPATLRPWQRLIAQPLSALLGRAITQVRGVQLVAQQDFWLALALIPGVGWFRKRPAFESLIWILFFGGAFVLMWVSPWATFNPGRSLGTFIPLVAIVGALGADAIVVAAHAMPFWPALTRPALGALGVLGIAGAMLSPMSPYAPDSRDSADELAALDGVLGGEPVASTSPWAIAATTRSPVVMIPENGEAAIEAVLRRYHVRWLVLIGKPTGIHKSNQVLDELRAGTRTRIGGLDVVKQPGGGAVVILRVNGG